MKTFIKLKTLSLAGLLLSLIFLQSCLKDKNTMSDFSGQTTQPIVEIHEGGFGNFAASALNLAQPGPDTLIFHVNLASKDFFNNDLVVNIGFDQNALNNYNAANGTNYEQFPDSIFSLPTKQVTIKAGTRTVAIPLIMYANKIDPTKSYM